MRRPACTCDVLCTIPEWPWPAQALPIQPLKALHLSVKLLIVVSPAAQQQAHSQMEMGAGRGEEVWGHYSTNLRCRDT